MTIDNQNEESSREGADQRFLSIGGSVDNSPIVVGDRNTIHQGHELLHYERLQPGQCRPNHFSTLSASQQARVSVATGLSR